MTSSSSLVESLRSLSFGTPASTRICAGRYIPVKEDAPEARVPSSVDNDRIAYGGDHSLGCARRHAQIVSAAVEKFGKAHLLAPLARVGHREDAENLCATSRRRARRIRRTRLREGVRGLGFHRESPPLSASFCQF
jgi:hypothetical protein